MEPHPLGGVGVCSCKNCRFSLLQLPGLFSLCSLSISTDTSARNEEQCRCEFQAAQPVFPLSHSSHGRSLKYVADRDINLPKTFRSFSRSTAKHGSKLVIFS